MKCTLKCRATLERRALELFDGLFFKNAVSLPPKQDKRVSVNVRESREDSIDIQEPK